MKSIYRIREPEGSYIAGTELCPFDNEVSANTRAKNFAVANPETPVTVTKEVPVVTITAAMDVSFTYHKENSE